MSPAWTDLWSLRRCAPPLLHQSAGATVRRQLRCREIKRRTNVVGTFPDVAYVERLVGAILLDIHDEWRSACHAAGAPLL